MLHPKVFLMVKAVTVTYYVLQESSKMLLFNDHMLTVLSSSSFKLMSTVFPACEAVAQLLLAHDVLRACAIMENNVTVNGRLACLQLPQEDKFKSPHCSNKS
ncbi:hypothetical protein CEXT_806031 [Caerostris extrusa]|uniref:Uncharacterized protein n=1 Tax=Caerostris extrusa TaxID=172846 RepID=A0AAV4X833_CAEEX|nr:hypothetical protein CEXT_806031 [Caerostris extrusa]